MLGRPLTGVPLQSGQIKADLHLVVVKGGREVRTVVEANAVTSIGIKVE